MNKQQLFVQLVSDIYNSRLIAYDHFTLVARNKHLRCVLAFQICETDIVIAVISQTEAARGFNSSFWQGIINKISQLQQEGKLCQQPLKS